jgi:hypothetical protein
MTNIHPVVTELFHADRQTDRDDEANRRFSQMLRTSIKLDLIFHVGVRGAGVV